MSRAERILWQAQLHGAEGSRESRERSGGQGTTREEHSEETGRAEVKTGARGDKEKTSAEERSQEVPVNTTTCVGINGCPSSSSCLSLPPIFPSPHPLLAHPDRQLWLELNLLWNS